jgi:hypothetical protein
MPRINCPDVVAGVTRMHDVNERALAKNEVAVLKTFS